MDDGGCPFTGLPCDGGAVLADGSVGCGFKEHPGAECDWAAEVPAGVSPRDFRNAMLIEVTEEPGQ